MKLLIVSDNHGEKDVVYNIKRKYEHSVDAMIHCGDSELNPDDEVLKGFICVRGNCDPGNQLPLEKTIEIKDNKIFITHGHLYSVKTNLLNIAYKAEEYGADLVIFGHSHIPGAEWNNHMLLVNPGSITEPRGRFEGSYAIVDKDDTYYNVTFYNRQHQKIDDLSGKFPHGK